MKKRFVTVLLALVGALCFAFGLSACDFGGDVQTPEEGGEQGGEQTPEQGGEQGGEQTPEQGGEEIVIEKTAGTEGLEYTLSEDGTYYICTGIGTATETDIEIASWYNDMYVTEIGSTAFRARKGLTSVVIPGSVTSIGESAFYHCAGLTSVEIPDSVTSIGDSAFFYCTELTSITIPDSVTSIGNSALGNCTSLTSISIPDSVTFIGNSAFRNCTGLTSIIVSGGNSTYHSDGNCLIETASKTLVLGCNNSVIPSDGSVTLIADFAFSLCTGLTSITIPDSVTMIGVGAFMLCTGLTSIVIPDSVTLIDRGAFYGCYKLVEVYDLSELTITAKSYGNGAVAFYALNIYTSVNEKSKLNTTDDGYIFYEDDDTVYLIGYTGTQTSLTLPDTYNEKNYKIYQYAFYNCTGLTSVTIDSGVTAIGNHAFADCSGLTSITISDSVTSIGGAAFIDCSSLTKVYYSGAEEDWGNITIDSSNTYLTDATRYYYSESNPFEGDNAVEGGNYWHYVDGEIIVWTKESATE